MANSINAAIGYALMGIGIGLAVDVTQNTDPRVTRIVERAINHERWCRQSVKRGLMTREDYEADPDAASLLDEREVECL